MAKRFANLIGGAWVEAADASENAQKRAEGYLYGRRTLLVPLPYGKAELSELLRRMAIARFGRRACAGRVGDAWLEWLERHDPAGFPWRREGRPLIDLPYAPPRGEGSGERLRPLIRAARAWLGPEPQGEEHPLGAEAAVPHVVDQRAAARATGRV